MSADWIVGSLIIWVTGLFLVIDGHLRRVSQPMVGAIYVSTGFLMLTALILTVLVATS